MLTRRAMLAAFGVALCGARLRGPDEAQPADDGREVGLTLDPNLAEYEPDEEVSGSIVVAGTELMAHLMDLCSKGFTRIHPRVAIRVHDRGGSSAIAALFDDRFAFGLLSRGLNDGELAEFKQKYGHEPKLLATALDMLAVIVHRDNPIESLTFPQVDAIYSTTRNLGAADDIATWGQLGLAGEWADRRIVSHGRNYASGNYGWFKELVLAKGDLKDAVIEHPGSTALRDAVAGNLEGIGYAGIGYVTDDVRAVPLTLAEDQAPVSPTIALATVANTRLRGFCTLARTLSPARNWIRSAASSFATSTPAKAKRPYCKTGTCRSAPRLFNGNLRRRD